MKAFDFITIHQIVGFLLILTRLTGVFLLSPLLNNRSVPERVKIPLVVMLTFLLIPVVPKVNIEVVNHIQLLVYIFEELTIGVTIGFVASLIFSTVSTAGEIFGMQIGYAIATILDPSQESETGVLTTLYVVMAALLFLYLDGHHAILVATAKSYEILPMTKGFNMNVGYGLSELVQRLLILSIQIAAPVVVVISILNLIFGLITKISPQMNIYFNVGFIVGPLVGVGVLLLSMPLFKVLMMKMTGELSHELMLTIRNLKGV